MLAYNIKELKWVFAHNYANVQICYNAHLFYACMHVCTVVL